MKGYPTKSYLMTLVLSPYSLLFTSPVRSALGVWHCTIGHATFVHCHFQQTWKHQKPPTVVYLGCAGPTHDDDSDTAGAQQVLDTELVRWLLTDGYSWDADHCPMMMLMMMTLYCIEDQTLLSKWLRLWEDGDQPDSHVPSVGLSGVLAATPWYPFISDRWTWRGKWGVSDANAADGWTLAAATEGSAAAGSGFTFRHFFEDMWLL